MITDDDLEKRRLKYCVEQWPECHTGGYDPHCCRFPKSCSPHGRIEAVMAGNLTEEDLEPKRWKGDIIPIGDECFAAGDETIISYKGENFYKACNAFVVDFLPWGGTAFCVKRVGHPGKMHESYEGATRWERSKSSMRTFIVYRTEAKSLKSDVDTHNYLEGDQPQFEGVQFSDGKVVQRWLTPSRSTVLWDSWEDLCVVHIYAHPDYGTRVEWSDGKVEDL